MYELNQILTLKKPHACGGKEWSVARIGADIKLQCKRCGKYINLTRDEAKKRVVCTCVKTVCTPVKGEQA